MTSNPTENVGTMSDESGTGFQQFSTIPTLLDDQLKQSQHFVHQNLMSARGTRQLLRGMAILVPRAPRFLNCGNEGHGDENAVLPVPYVCAQSNLPGSANHGQNLILKSSTPPCCRVGVVYLLQLIVPSRIPFSSRIQSIWIQSIWIQSI